MCLSPITIPNRVSSYDPRYDRLYHTVACGHCAECIKLKRNDWFVRSYYEWLNCKSKGGYALFITLTYSNDWIPCLQCNGRTVYCFDKVDVQKFLDALRKSIKRKYHRDLPFRYIITSEYGGDTHRPHYHGILYVQYGVSGFFLREEIKRLWHYGFVSFGQNLGVINDYRGLKYVVKYISKDVTYAPIQRYIQLQFPKDSYLYYHNRCSPFHIQSNGLGECAKKYVSSHLLEQGVIPIPSDKGFINVKLPLYLNRKYYYEYNPVYKGYYPTSEGVRVSLLRHSKVQSYIKEHYDNLFNNCHNLLTDDAIELLRERNITELSKFDIECLIKNVHKEYDDFLYYIENERYYMYITHGFPNPIQSNQAPTFFNVIQRKYEIGQDKEFNEFHSSSSEYSTISSDVRLRKVAEQYSYNNISTNQNFELCAQIFECLQFSYSLRKQTKENVKSEKLQNLQLFKSIYKYGQYF